MKTKIDHLFDVYATLPKNPIEPLVEKLNELITAYNTLAEHIERHDDTIESIQLALDKEFRELIEAEIRNLKPTKTEMVDWRAYIAATQAKGEHDENKD